MFKLLGKRVGMRSNIAHTFIYISCIACMGFLLSNPVFGQESREKEDQKSITIDPVVDEEDENEPIIKSPLSWFNKIEIGGYTQLRYNRLLETNSDLQCEQCDPSWGGTGGFGLRRLRVEFKGFLTEKIYLYIMPEFAFGFNHAALLREGWVDVGLDRKNEFRLRFGQSRVPIGFDNLQDSRHRIAMDRSDAINSGQLNERDIGIFFYWTPRNIQSRIVALIENGLKGANDHGMVGFGVYNGQGGNVAMNPVSHVAGRISYPFLTSTGQIIETSLQAYMGTYDVNTTLHENTSFDDRRVTASFIYYPQPFGIQAEYTMGVGPRYDPGENRVIQDNLEGGYIQAMYFIKGNKHQTFPYARYQYYNGGKKFELDATQHVVSELELGVEWQPNRALEFSAGYVFSDRTFENSLRPINNQSGTLLRLQVQAKF